MEKCNTEEMYHLYRERLLSLIQAKVEDTQKAEDLLHDSFIKLENCCDQDCECNQPRSYLFRLALNVVFDYFKKRKKDRLTKIEFTRQIDSSNKDQSEASCDILKCINQFLTETSAENRIAYEQVDLLQKSQIEVAKSLKIPLPTLKSRVQRTRKYLKAKIENCCPDNKTKCY